MRSKLAGAVLCIAVVGVGAIYHVESARATAASGFSGKNLIPFTATFGSFQVFNHLTQDELKQLAPTFPDSTWSAFEKTQGPSDLYLQSNTWQPGGSTGWHKHLCEFQIVIMTKGWARFMYEDKSTLVQAGDVVHQRPGIVHYLYDYSPDMEYMEIVSPADFKTVDMPPATDKVPPVTPWK